MDVWCWKDLETTAKCPLCSETLKDPKTLPCLHSFCLLCLDSLARIERRRHQDEISCPICQTSFPIPEANTFIDLPTSFHLNRFKGILTLSNGNQTDKMCQICSEGKTAISYCFVCQQNLCFSCDKVHRRLRTTRDHRSILLQNELHDLLQRPVMCTLEFHEEEGLKYFCQQCNECICDVCYMDEGHWQHEVVDIQQAAHEVKKQLNKTLTKAEEEMIVCEV